MVSMELTGEGTVPRGRDNPGAEVAIPSDPHVSGLPKLPPISFLEYCPCHIYRLSGIHAVAASLVGYLVPVDTEKRFITGLDNASTIRNGHRRPRSFSSCHLMLLFLSTWQRSKNFRVLINREVEVDE
jgi:hypothetical protein